MTGCDSTDLREPDISMKENRQESSMPEDTLLEQEIKDTPSLDLEENISDVDRTGEENGTDASDAAMIEEPDGGISDDHAIMEWPATATPSWDRFFSYGGSFYIDQWNTWVCDIGGTVIAWEGNRWTYRTDKGDYFIQYNDSDYFHIDTSDPYYSWTMHSLTGWMQLTPSGMVSCDEPQIFSDDVEALKQAVYDTNFYNKIASFESMGFTCFEEDGVWKCDTNSGILTYDADSHIWYGTVDVYSAQTDSWEYGAEIMSPNANITCGDEYFRYTDGRYDEGTHSTDSLTTPDGQTYSVRNYGMPGTAFYNENKDILDSMVGSDFIGFWCYEYNYPVRIYEEDLKLSLAPHESKTITLYKEFSTDFDLSCEYDDSLVTTTWGKWQNSYLTPRIELTITAISPGITTLKIYSERYPSLVHEVEVVIE